MCAADPVLLDALAARLLAARGGMSAVALAAEFGCAPGEMAGMVATLRGLGADVREVAEGYVLVLADRLEATAIRSVLPGDSRLNIAVKQVCNTTNEAVRVLPQPALCVAEVQLAGRGRRGASWMQPFGAGLALSLAAPAPRGRLDPLAIALALASLDCLEILGYSGIRLKWPNDLFARDAKLGGLMVEVEGGATPRLRVGLGINVHAIPSGLDRETVALAGLGPPPVRNHLAAALGVALMEALERYDAEGFAPFAAAFPAHDWLSNRPITLHEQGAAVAGVARGIDASGALMLETEGGRKTYRAGEVSLGNPLEVSP